MVSSVKVSSIGSHSKYEQLTKHIKEYFIFSPQTLSIFDEWNSLHLEPSESRIQQIITKNWVSNANIYIKIWPDNLQCIVYHQIFFDLSDLSFIHLPCVDRKSDFGIVIISF